MSKIKILFLGDYSPSGNWGNLAFKNGKKFLSSFYEKIQSSSYVMVNFEGSIESKYNKQKILKSGPTIKLSKDSIRYLSSLKINAINLANNHSLDLGINGLHSTIKLANSYGIDTVGAGASEHLARSPLIKKIAGVKICFLSVAEDELNIAEDKKGGVASLDIMSLSRSINKAKLISDVIILNVHAGNEFFPLPRPELRRQLRFLTELGVDAIICHHTHIQSAYEIFKKVPIYYGIGNFLFYNKSPQNGWDAGLAISLEIDIVKKKIVSHKEIPFIQDFKKRCIRLCDKKENKEWIKKQNSLNKILKNEKLYKKKWKTYVNKEGKLFVVHFFTPFFFRGIDLVSKIFSLWKFFLFGKRNRIIKLNMLKCDSNREIVKDFLNQKL